MIAFLGDSLTAGLGLLTDQAFPPRSRALFAAEGYGEVEVVNAGVSGDTTAGGLRRVEQVLEPDVRILVVALGGNDALRGLTVGADARQPGRHHRCLPAAKGVERRRCVGMEAPTNLGEDYRDGVPCRLRPAGATSFRRTGSCYIPFLLEGVAGHPALNQADGIHPNEQGAQDHRRACCIRSCATSMDPAPESAARLQTRRD